MEPRREFAGTILFEELEEVNEVIFISKGNVDIGYEINKQRKFILRQSNNIVVGAFNIINNVRTIFVWKCQSECTGYSIRKKAMIEILDEFPDIASHIKQNCEHIYEFKIRRPIMKIKQKHLQKLSKRKDLS